LQLAYRTAYRHAVDEQGFGQRPATIPVADCEGGEEVQLDTGSVGLAEAGPDRPAPTVSGFDLHGGALAALLRLPDTPRGDRDGDRGRARRRGDLWRRFKMVIPDNTKPIVNEADALEPKLVLGLSSAHRAAASIDFSIIRNTRFGRYNLALRAEALNVPNHPQLNLLNGVIRRRSCGDDHLDAPEPACAQRDEGAQPPVLGEADV
jgi:hypothetical protein